MDTVTHALVGAAVSDSYFRRRLGPAATPFALLAAAAPDIDSFTYFVSTEMALANHRGYTHSLLPIVLAAPLLALAGHAIANGRARWRSGWTESWALWTVLALLCLLSHTLFDLMTSWGTMPLLPFSNARLSWDILPIIDAFLLAVTGASFVANRILRREKVDTFINPLVYPVVHRHPGRQRAGDLLGKIAVALVVVYILLGWQQNRQAVRIATETLRAQGVRTVDVRALPVLLTYIAYDIAALDGEGAVHNSAYSSYAGNDMRFRTYPPLPPAETARELESPEGKFFAWYTQGMFVSARAEGAEGKGIVLRDRRFFRVTDPDASRFETTFLYDSAGNRSVARLRQQAYGRMDIRAELSALWRLTWEGRGAGFDDLPMQDAAKMD